MNYNLLTSLKLSLLIAFFIFGCKKQSPEDQDLYHPQLTSFKFSNFKNDTLFYDINGTIEGDTVFVRYFAGFDPKGLVPEFTTVETETVEVNGVVQESGNTAVDFAAVTPYVLKFKNSSHTFFIKFQDLGVPAIYVSTGGTPILNKEDYVTGTVKIYSGVPGQLLHEGTMRIRGRGNSTWNMPKKPYKMKLDESAALLGMPENKDWALMANYADRSLMRNEVGFEVSRRVGLAYTPRQRYADFFLNNSYQGNYNLAEHQETGSDKIDIDEDNGGYYLEVDGYAGSEPVHFFTNHNVPVTVKFPDEEEISTDQLNYISGYFQDFEDRLFSNNFKDPNEGYRKILDLPSFINYYLANEVSGNPDMLWSMKMYKNSGTDPLLYTGPVWDFDLAVNNDKRLGDAQELLMLDKAHFVRAWIDRLREDPELMLQIRERWNQVKPTLATIPDYVDSLALSLQFSQKPNFIRWDILSEPNIHLSWFTGNSFEEYVAFLREYYSKRLVWLDQVINSSGYIPE
ncbi:CotH kinase family protein [Niabella terrae]